MSGFFSGFICKWNSVGPTQHYGEYTEAGVTSNREDLVEQSGFRRCDLPGLADAKVKRLDLFDHDDTGDLLVVGNRSPWLFPQAYTFVTMSAPTCV
jgi:hypothetical protein